MGWYIKNKFCESGNWENRNVKKKSEWGCQPDWGKKSMRTMGKEGSVARENRAFVIKKKRRGGGRISGEESHLNSPPISFSLIFYNK